MFYGSKTPLQSTGGGGGGSRKVTCTLLQFYVNKLNRFWLICFVSLDAQHSLKNRLPFKMTNILFFLNQRNKWGGKRATCGFTALSETHWSFYPCDPGPDPWLDAALLDFTLKLCLFHLAPHDAVGKQKNVRRTLKQFLLGEKVYLWSKNLNRIKWPSRPWTHGSAAAVAFILALNLLLQQRYPLCGEGVPTQTSSGVFWWKSWSCGWNVAAFGGLC